MSAEFPRAFEFGTTPLVKQMCLHPCTDAPVNIPCKCIHIIDSHRKALNELQTILIQLCSHWWTDSVKHSVSVRSCACCVCSIANQWNYFCILVSYLVNAVLWTQHWILNVITTSNALIHRHRLVVHHSSALHCRVCTRKSKQLSTPIVVVSGFLVKTLSLG